MSKEENKQRSKEIKLSIFNKVLISSTVLIIIEASIFWERTLNSSIEISFYLFGPFFALLTYLILPRFERDWNKLKSEIVVGLFSAAIAYIIIKGQLNIQTIPANLLFSVFLGIVTAIFYHIHISAIITRWHDKIEGDKINITNQFNQVKEKIKNENNSLQKEIKLTHEKFEENKKSFDEILDNIKIKILPLYDLLITNNNFRRFGDIVQRRMNGVQYPFINHVLIDQSKFLEKSEWLFSREQYLIMLEEFSNNSSSLYCINQTLPIFWYSPKPNESTFVLDYGNEISDDNIYRITVVENKKKPPLQYEMAFRYIQSHFEESKAIIVWSLILFSRFYSILSDGIKKTLLKNLPKQLNDELDDFLVNNYNYGEGERASDVTRVGLNAINLLTSKDIFLSNCENILENLKRIAENEGNCREINQIINEKFISDHKEIGCYYISSDKLKTIEPSFAGYGELGVYLNRNDKPWRVFATKGDLSDIIKVVHIDSSSTYVKLKKIIEDAKNSKENSLGNIRSILENNE